jgi:hypothetical protein
MRPERLLTARPVKSSSSSSWYMLALHGSLSIHCLPMGGGRCAGLPANTARPFQAGPNGPNGPGAAGLLELPSARGINGDGRSGVEAMVLTAMQLLSTAFASEIMPIGMMHSTTLLQKLVLIKRDQ